MSKKVDKKLWGVLGKQQTYYSPQQFLQGKTKVPLNASPFESWDAKRSKYNRVDGFENRIQQHGVVPQDTTPSVSPTPSTTPSQTPGASPTPTPSNTATNTSTPTPTPSITPVVDCYWNTNDDNWENDSTLWNDCVNVPSPTPTNTQTNTPTNTQTNTPTNTTTTTPTNTPTNTQTNTPTNTTTTTPTNTPTNTNTATNTPTPSTTPPPSGTTEARTYLAAVLAGGGTGLTPTISAATETLFTSLVSNNLWDKITIFYPFLGGTSGGCKVNGKNPGSNDLTFNGGWTFGVSGATPNGTNAYADTAYSYRNLSVNSNHSSMYSLTRSENIGNEWGTTDGTGRYLVYLNQLNIQSRREFGIAPFKSSGYDLYESNTNVRGDGMYVMNRSSSSATQGYINGTRYINTTTSTSTTFGTTNYSIYLGARNAAGTAAAFSERRFAFWTIGTSLTSGETATLTTIINTFQTSLSRNVY